MGHNLRNITTAETGTVRKSWKGRISVALIYPNTYHVGMSNLGFQSVYRLLNDMTQVVCERAFLPEDITRQKLRRADGQTAGIPASLESGKKLIDFDIIAFSISFENDYPGLLTILEKAGLPLLSRDRGSPHPLITAGGVACFLNPEPIASFIDCFFIGEAEAILPDFFNIYRPAGDLEALLRSLAREVTGIYVPRLYQPIYSPKGTLMSFEPRDGAPQKVKRVYLKDLTHTSTMSAVLTPHTTFDRTCLIETGRGCPHGCRFCGAGFVYRPPRFRPAALLVKCMEAASQHCDHIGLVGTAISDLPGLKELCAAASDESTRLSFSSLRADALSPELLTALRRSKVKTATIAPDAGSKRMREVINKGITEEDVVSAAENLVENGIPNLKIYFMVGLPYETDRDVDAIIDLVNKIKHRFLKASRPRKFMGEITVSLNCFIPKPFTPFQWAAMAEVAVLKQKIKKIKNGLKKLANVRVRADIPRWAFIQSLFSNGDRHVADILLLAHSHHGNWPRTFKETPLNPAFYVLRERDPEELFPWDFMDHGLSKSFLLKEYEKAAQGKTSPPCPMNSCDVCGVCQDNHKTVDKTLH